MTYYTRLPSPIGPLLLTSDGASLTGIFMGEHRHGPVVGPEWAEREDAAPFAEARRQLNAYFEGSLREFGLPLAARGTEFQQRVWKALCEVPYGETLSYGELAARLGQPGAARAVGLANGRNPLSIIVPCHRIVGAGGALTGYGGGLDRKQALLAFERSVLAGCPDASCWVRTGPRE